MIVLHSIHFFLSSHTSHLLILMKFISLQDRYAGPIATSLKEKLGLKNTYALPRVQKVTVNVGINKTKMDSKEMHEYVEESLKQITGQKPILRKSRLSIANFKIREGLVVGAQVTLRGKHMYNFLDRFLHTALPRVRDFRGVTTKREGKGKEERGRKEKKGGKEGKEKEEEKGVGMKVNIKN